MTEPVLHPLRLLRVALIAAGLVISVGGGSLRSAEPRRSPDDPKLAIPDSLRGRSGRLKARIVPPEAQGQPAPELLQAPSRRLTLLAVRDSSTDEPFHFISLVPFAAKHDDRVGIYRVGRWPAEARQPRSPAYDVPPGFIEVTEENQDIRISTHFRLRDFLNRDQVEIWPKPLVLDPRLVDKLELIIDELRMAGHAVSGLTVLSGFRTPRANARGARSALSTESRHQYGDAADVIVDVDGDGRMDDLNRDGRSDHLDARVFLEAVDRVESNYPDLVGGTGLYRNTAAGGTFIHVDTRGSRVRW
ncbi:MAG: hypothetical protein WD771_08510 [Gemmatimonadaceae bacterium]